MTRIRSELLDELLAGHTSQDALFGPNGLLKQITGALVERALSAELGHHLTSERAAEGGANRRNGHSSKTLQTEQGPVPIAVPRDRASTFEPQLVKKHQTRIPALDDKILALYARGLSARDIQAHLLELYGTEISPTLISDVTEAVRDEITAWQNRPLDPVFTVVWLDALIIKVRDEGVVKNKAAYLAIGLDREGHKQILGLWLESSEGAKMWLRILNELRTRGLQDILIACCDGLKGFPEAIEAAFPQTVVQTCIVHQVRHSLNFVGYAERKQVAADLRAIYTAPNEAGASAALTAFEAKWGARFPTIGPSWRANWTRLTPFLAFPAEIRAMVYTTNAIESLNFTLRKVIKSKGHFPSDEAAIKLLYLALRNAEKKWQAAPRNWKRIYSQLVIFFGDRMTA